MSEAEGHRSSLTRLEGFAASSSYEIESGPTSIPPSVPVSSSLQQKGQSVRRNAACRRGTQNRDHTYRLCFLAARYPLEVLNLSSHL